MTNNPNTSPWKETWCLWFRVTNPVMQQYKLTFHIVKYTTFVVLQISYAGFNMLYDKPFDTVEEAKSIADDPKQVWNDRGYLETLVPHVDTDLQPRKRKR